MEISNGNRVRLVLNGKSNSSESSDINQRRSVVGRMYTCFRLMQIRQNIRNVHKFDATIIYTRNIIISRITRGVP